MTENPLDLVSSLHFEYFWRGFTISGFLSALTIYFNGNSALIVALAISILGLAGVKYSQYMREKHD